MRGLFGCLVSAALAFTAAPAGADSAPALTSLWRLDGPTNTLYLLGSIHLLRESDYPLDPALLAAYEDAEAVLMEIDLDDLDPAAAAATVEARSRLAAGQSLRTLLGEDAWLEANRTAAAAGYDLAAFEGSEPWFVALALTQLTMAAQGYSADMGVDRAVARLAAADGKPVEGLETFEQQIGFFDDLTPALQRDLLLQTLADLDQYEGDMSAMVAAWKSGDTAFLEDELLDELKAYPELYDALVVRRSTAWLPVIEALLDRDDDYLIVVGTLHLVGAHGLPELLSQRGYRLEQVEALAEPARIGAAAD